LISLRQQCDAGFAGDDALGFKHVEQRRENFLAAPQQAKTW
jgi:hypothetical protein